MRVLIIAWYFPPWNATASDRPASWAAWFAKQGCRVNVLTSKKNPAFHGDLSLPLEPHPNLRVVETPLRLTRTPIAKGASWAAGSVAVLRRLAREADAVISTFMPWYIHVLGHLAKRANPRAVWCADYRDLWHDYDFFTAARPWKRRLLRWFEKLVVRPADLTTTVSHPLAQKLAKTHPHITAEVIYNGFPASLLNEEGPAARIAARFRERAPVEIMYAGTLYSGGYHDPEPLFQAIASGKWSRPIRVFFYGASARSPVVQALREKYRLGDAVRTPEEPLPRAACVAREREADLLLHLGWTNPKMDGVLSAKVFEYMASRTPILSVGAGREAAIGKLLEETGAGACLGRDVEAIRRALDQVVNRGELPEWYCPNREAILRFTRENQAQRLLEILRRRVKGGSPGKGGASPLKSHSEGGPEPVQSRGKAESSINAKD